MRPGGPVRRAQGISRYTWQPRRRSLRLLAPRLRHQVRYQPPPCMPALSLVCFCRFCCAHAMAFFSVGACSSAWSNTTPRFWASSRSIRPVWVAWSVIFVPGACVCSDPTRALPWRIFAFRRVAPHGATRHPDFGRPAGPSGRSGSPGVLFSCLARACVHSASIACVSVGVPHFPLPVWVRILSAVAEMHHHDDTPGDTVQLVRATCVCKSLFQACKTVPSMATITWY